MIHYALAFCRIATGLVFAWSFIGKVRDIPSFVQTINSFQLLPKSLHRPVAILFLGGEMIVIGLMIIGGKLLQWGFLLAGLLLIFFSIALASVLIRKIKTSCNCFGTSQNPVSTFDIVRNIILTLLSLIAYSLLAINAEHSSRLGWLDWGLTSFVAITFVVILIQIREIVQLFH